MRILSYFLISFAVFSCTGQERYFKINTNCAEIDSLDKKITFLFFDSEGQVKPQLYELGPSKKLKDDILADTTFLKEIKANYSFLLVNQKCKTSRNLTSRYDVLTFPTIILTDNTGKEKKRLVGYAIIPFIQSRLFKKKIEVGKTSTTHSITHPNGTIDLKNLPIDIDDFWKVIEGEISFADKVLNKGKFLTFSPFGFQWGDKEFTIKADQHAQVIHNRSSGNNLSIDFYIDTLNQITFRKIIYRDNNQALLKNLAFEEKTFDLNILNKNEIEISNQSSRVKMVRDTLREWKN